MLNIGTERADTTTGFNYGLKVTGKSSFDGCRWLDEVREIRSSPTEVPGLHAFRPRILRSARF